MRGGNRKSILLDGIATDSARAPVDVGDWRQQEEMYGLETRSVDLRYRQGSHCIEGTDTPSPQPGALSPEKPLPRPYPHPHSCSGVPSGPISDSYKSPIARGRRSSTELLLEFDDGDEGTKRRILRDVAGSSRDRELKILLEYEKESLRGKTRIWERRLRELENGRSIGDDRSGDNYSLDEERDV